METDTKSMSREDALEAKFVCPSACDWYKPVIEAMEEYKDSCLAAQKAEMERYFDEQLILQKDIVRALKDAMVKGGDLYDSIIFEGEPVPKRVTKIRELEQELSRLINTIGEQNAKAFDDGAIEIRRMIAVGFRENIDKAPTERDRDVFEAIADTLPEFPLPFNPYRQDK